MVRDIRTSPRGLIAPLKQAELASLRRVLNGARPVLPDAHRVRLFELALIEKIDGQLAVTELGRERLTCDR